MKAQNLLTLMFLLACATLVRAEDEAMLFRFPLAGMPVASVPPPGTPLELLAEDSTPETPYPVAVYWEGRRIGQLPARHAEAPYRLLAQGVNLHCEAHSRMQPALPGHYLTVELSLPGLLPRWDLAQLDAKSGDWPED